MSGDLNGTFDANYFFAATGQPEFATVGGNWNATTTLVESPNTVASARGLWIGPSSIAGSFGGVTRLRRLSSPITAGTVTGQVVVNAFSSSLPGTGWDPAATVTVGSNVLTPPNYLATPQQIGGGSIGLAPFRMHRTASTPAYSGTGPGKINNTSKIGPAYESPAVAFYGPVKPGTGSTPLFNLQRRVGTTADFMAVNESEKVAFTIIDDGAFDRRVRIFAQNGSVSPQINRPPAARLLPGRYRAWATARLECDLVSGTPAPAVLNEVNSPFEFTIIDGCSPADIANTDGDYVPDGVIDNGDFSTFFTAFFLTAPDLNRFYADIANTDGEVASGWPGGTADGGPDGQIDNGDFMAFFAAFFNGCSSSALGGGESMLAALSATAGGQAINLSALTSAELSARLEQLRALGRPITLQDVQTIMPEIFVGGAGGGGAGDQ